MRKRAEREIGPNRQQFFVGYPYAPRLCNRENLKSQILDACDALPFEPYFYDDDFGARPVLDKIFERIEGTAFGVYDLSDGNSNVLIEMGYAFGKRKRVVILRQRGGSFEIPSDIQSIERIEYDDLIDLQRKLRAAIKAMTKQGRVAGHK